MSEPNPDKSSSLVLYGSRELAAPETAQNRILSEMVEASLAMARETAVAHVDLDALVREGKRIQRNEGMTPEDIQAFHLFHQAAAAGHAEAEFLVFECYFGGHGISEDLSNSIEWLHQSAEHGFADAQFHLGRGYSLGKGVPQDYAEAVNWYRMAAAQEGVFVQALAQNNLGYCYESGQGVMQDYEEAAKWYRMAAERGMVYAQDSLGCCYGVGQGVPQDYAEIGRAHV